MVASKKINDPSSYIIKKGPADPFRGNWYTDEEIFSNSSDAIAKASELTRHSYSEFKDSWEEFGYEWSVFEKTNSSEKKIWEGYKYVKFSVNSIGDLNSGMI